MDGQTYHIASNARASSQNTHSNKKGKRIKRTRSPAHAHEGNHTQFYRSTNLPLTYQTAGPGQHLIQQNQQVVYHGAPGQYAPGVGGTPFMTAGINQKLAHQFMLKQQFKQDETELNIPQGVEDFDPGFQSQQPQNQRQLQGMVTYNYASGK